MEWVREHRRALAVGAALLAAVVVFWPVARSLAGLCVGGAALAFVLHPLVTLLARHMRRSAAILISFGCVAALAAGAVVMLVPIFARQVQQLIGALPTLTSSMASVTQWLQAQLTELSARIRASGVGESVMSQLTSRLDQLPGQVAGALGAMLSGTATVAGSVADGVGRFSLMVILCYYFLKDRERVLMQLELLLPHGVRACVVETGGAIQRELGGYVRGQLLISLIVGGITAAGLAVLGVPSFLVLGLIMAVFNLVPYFGALLGAVPILLLTLGMGWGKVAQVGVMLFAAQQVENMVIAPRVTGKTTGLHPVAVILALTAGGMLGGVMGMVFAIPGAIVLRGVLRAAVSVRSEGSR